MRISVICPSYNRASFLEECIAAVMALPNAEFLLVDDGSTDGTLELARSLQARYGADRIFVISLGGNQGAQIARNRGMDAAQGDMILFCDSDDVLIASGVAKLAETLSRDPTLDYAYGKVIMTDASLKPLNGVDPIGSAFEDYPYEMAGYHWHTMGALYRKSYLVKVGPWNPALTGSQDWEYQARVKLAGGRGLFVDSLVGYWRQHDGGRVGTKKFRPDYVRSVADACLAILDIAQRVGRCDRAFESRLGKKLILHAIEAGAFNHHKIKRYCLQTGINKVKKNLLINISMQLLIILPETIDHLIYKSITLITNQRKNKF